jgi:peptide/nickel transport system permease protein
VVNELRVRGSGDAVTLPQLSPARPRRTGRFWRLVRQQPAGAIAAILLSAILLAGLFANVVAPYDPTAQIIPDALLPPFGVGQNGTLYLLGTDGLGRDVFSRLIFGARISLEVGTAAVSIGTIGGLLVGVVSGYRGGRIDMLVQRLSDAMQAIPTLVLALLLVSVLGKSLAVTAIAIGLTQIPRVNRLIRSNVLTVIHEPYIEAARSTGARELRIALRHVLPNVVPLTLIVFSTSIAGAIVVESTLSFLGLAAPPPLASWGGMLSLDGQQYMLRAPWLLVAPTVALSVTVLCFNFVGDAVRDLLDPRLRNRS